MNYYDEIKERLVKNEIVKEINNYNSNKSDLRTYYDVGKLLSEAGYHYGEEIIKRYSVKLTNELGKKYGISTLKRMRQFYLIIQKGAPFAHQISWSHYQELLPLKDIGKIQYYINISISQNLSRNKLREKIKSNEYERLSEKTKNKLINNQKLEVSDYIKEPIVIHKNNIEYDKLSEFALKQYILRDMDNFLHQLGEGFTYVGNEYKIKMGNTYNFIDILLFNIEYNCYIIVELKIMKVNKNHIGQVQVYMNYINEHLRKPNQDKTIGIIVCKENNEYLIKYSSDARIHVTTYELV